MCFYYSQALDWEDPDAVGNTWDYDPDQKEFARFLNGKCKAQLRELLTQYGPIGLIWFDVPEVISWDQSLELKQLVRSLQPGCLVSGRISLNPGMADYGSLGDNQLPAGRLTEDWETPATLNDAWGFKRTDHKWKSSESLIRLLIELAAKGANYLLNIGPCGDGSIPERSTEILGEIGQWIATNGEAIYGTSASPFPTDFEWGRVTTKGDILYLHLFEWRETLEIAGLQNKVLNTKLLSIPGIDLSFDQKQLPKGGLHRLTVHLPAVAPSAHVHVLRLQLNSKPKVDPLPAQQPDGSIKLPACLAELHHAKETIEVNEAQDDDTAIAAEAFNLLGAQTMGRDVSGVIENWFDPNSHISWEFHLDTPGTYELELRTFSMKYKPWVGGHDVRIELGKQTKQFNLSADTEPNTASRQYFSETGSLLGPFVVEAAGKQTLHLFLEKLNTHDPRGLAVSELIIRKPQHG